MNYNYALIIDGIVSNIIVLHPSNAKDFSSAVPIGDYSVSIGDTYDGTNFFHNGEQLKTEKQRIIEENQDLTAAFNVLGIDVYSMEDVPNE